MNALDHDSATSSTSDTSEKSGRAGPPALPDASIYPFSPVGTKSMLGVPAESEPKAVPKKQSRGTMFDTLVADDTDLVGMVAYAIYKQNKGDFLGAFEKMHARMPDENEIRAYMLGEETSRRVGTYRHLAENFLASQKAGSWSAKAPSPTAAATARPATARRGTFSETLAQRMVGRRKGGPSWLMAAYIGFLLLLLAGMAYLIRNGFSSGK